MATTTPNYGWPVPTSSDLVKNGATAIEALGDAADATMATMVPKSIVDAKGDIIAATAADTVSRLAVGANNTVLTADSTTATGLKWATPAAGGGGKVLQVVFGSTSTETFSSTNTFVDTNLTATITPTSATSKILVIVSQASVAKINDTRVTIQLLRGATVILRMGDGNAHTGTAIRNNIGTVSASFLDAPATTSATTYKTQFASQGNAAQVTVQEYFATSSAGVSTITLLEIGA